MVTYPSDYSNNFDKTKNHRKMIFRDTKYLTGNDCNVLQDILDEKRKDFANVLMNDGDLLEGGQPSIDSGTGEVSISEGVIYVDGEIFEFAEDTSLTIATDKEVEIGVYLVDSIVGQTEDPSIVDPSSGYVTSGLETQRRLKKEISWGWKNTDNSGDSGHSGTFFPVHLSNNGVLVISNEAPTFGNIDTAIATYDRDSSGGFYVVNGFQVLLDDTTDPDYVYSVKEGKCRINGFPISILSGTRLAYTKDPDLSLVQNESHTQTVSGGEAVVTTNNSPINDVVSVQAKLRKTESVTRGVVADTSDDLEEAGAYAIVGIAGYTEGVDFQLTGAAVDWSLGGSEPSGGASYDVEYDFIKSIGIKEGSLTNTQFTIEDQDGGNEALINGESCTINYNYKLQRIDLIELDSSGSFQRTKGIPHRSAPTKPLKTPGRLPLATIKLTWDSDPVIFQIAPTTVPMGDLNLLQQQTQSNTLMIAELAQQSQSKLINGQVHNNLFLDILVDDSQRSLEAGDDLQISAGMLTLPLTIQDDYPDNANNDSIQTLDYTLENIVSQEKETGQIKINPYDTFTNIPGTMTVSNRIDNDVIQFTTPFICRGSQAPNPPITTTDTQDVGIEQISPTLAIQRAGAVTTVNPPASYDEAYAQSLEFFQNNRHNINKTTLNKRQKKKVKNLAGNLLAGEDVSTVKVNGKEVTIT